MHNLGFLKEVEITTPDEFYQIYDRICALTHSHHFPSQFRWGQEKKQFAVYSQNTKEKEGSLILQTQLISH